MNYFITDLIRENSIFYIFKFQLADIKVKKSF